MSLFEHLKALCTLDGVSGDEWRVRDYIKNAAAPYADKIFTDSLGNLFVFKKGSKPCEKKLMVAAHMDEVGFIVNRITDDGYLKISSVGGFDPRVLIGRSLHVGDDKHTGVIGIKAVHLTTEDERKSIAKISSLYVDIGCTSKEECEKYVKIGDYASFDTEYTEFGDGMIKAKAIDDRVGCAVMLSLIEEETHYDTDFVFTVQEEVGCRGARIAAYRLKPDIALILEGTTCAEMAEVPDTKKVCRARHGAVASFMDRGTIYNRELVAKMFAISREKKIPLQYKELVSGGTDAGAISKSNDGTKCVGLAAPVRYIHAASTAVCKSDVEAVYALAKEFCGDRT